MLLIFNRTSSNCHIRNQIIYQRKVFWVQHLIRCRHSCFRNNTVMQVTNRLDPIDKARRFFGIWLVNQALIAITISTWFSSVDAHHHKDAIFDFFLQFCQTLGILKNCFFIVRRTRTNHQQNALIFTTNNRFKFLIALLFIGKCLSF